MSNQRLEWDTQNKTDEQLADLLSMGPPGDSRVRAAQAEFRLLEHRALIKQSEAAVSYTRYTFWVVLLSAITASASVGSLLLKGCGN
jgi:hypothetical protein